MYIICEERDAYVCHIISSIIHVCQPFTMRQMDRFRVTKSLISSKTTAFTFQMFRKKNVYFWQKWINYQLEELLIKYFGLKWISFSLILLMLDLFSTFKKGLKELNCQNGNSPNFWNSNLAIPYSFPKTTWFSLYILVFEHCNSVKDI